MTPGKSTRSLCRGREHIALCQVTRFDTGQSVPASPTVARPHCSFRVDHRDVIPLSSPMCLIVQFDPDALIPDEFFWPTETRLLWRFVVQVAVIGLNHIDSMVAIWAVLCIGGISVCAYIHLSILSPLSQPSGPSGPSVAPAPSFSTTAELPENWETLVWMLFCSQTTSRLSQSLGR